jgi:DNA-binding transcriptional regulator YdaS (Cro superfamily)
MESTTDLIKAAIAQLGSEKKLGDAAGVSQHAIWSAKKKGRVTAELAAAIDRATAGRVSKSALRPDIFGG